MILDARKKRSKKEVAHEVAHAALPLTQFESDTSDSVTLAQLPIPIPPSKTMKRKLVSVKVDESAEKKKEAALWRPWFSVKGKTFAKWNAALNDFEVDFDNMWKEIVKPELEAQAAFSTWRTRPCCKIATRLPQGFTSWSEVLRHGGPKDASTGKPSLTAEQLKHFWNDQCDCPCWCPEQRKAPKAASPLHAVAKEVAEWDVVLDRLMKTRKALPRQFHAEVDACIATVKASKAAGVQPREIFAEALNVSSWQDAKQDEVEQMLLSNEVSKSCFQFWWNLENEFIIATGRKAQTGEEMLNWVWRTAERQEFQQIWQARKRSI